LAGRQQNLANVRHAARWRDLIADEGEQPPASNRRPKSQPHTSETFSSVGQNFLIW
jgi:hypothetical protein